MPWCPHCRTEYREGFTTCADCGMDLVETLPPSKEDQIAAFAARCNAEPLDPVILFEALDHMQTALAEQLLEEAGIASYHQGREAGGFLDVAAGYSVFGNDLYVDRKDLERAREVLDGFLGGLPEKMEEAEEEPASFDEESRRRRLSQVLVWLWVGAILLGLLGGGIAALRSLFF